VNDAPRDPAEVETQGFPHKPFLRVGYDRAAVDEFVTLVALAIHNERQTTVSADDVARTRFPSRRLGRGYRMREVDDYLGVVEALLRMRATGRGVGPGPHRTDPETPEPQHRRHHEHHPTWWIYGVAALLIVVIVVFTVTQT
jgi:DivIVA domain-containing protein